MADWSDFTPHMTTGKLCSIQQQTQHRLYQVSQLRDEAKGNEDLDAGAFQGNRNAIDLEETMASIREEAYLRAHEISPDDRQRIEDFETDEELAGFDGSEE
jgi:hypothetical protein